MGETLFQLIESKANENAKCNSLYVSTKRKMDFVKLQRSLERANKLASSLSELGIRKGDIISSFSNNCIELNILDLALFKTWSMARYLFPQLSTRKPHRHNRQNQTKVNFRRARRFSLYYRR